MNRIPLHVSRVLFVAECLQDPAESCRDRRRPPGDWCVICSAQALLEQNKRDQHIADWLAGIIARDLHRRIRRWRLAAFVLAALASYLWVSS